MLTAKAAPLLSHRCGWRDLAAAYMHDDASRTALDLGSGWTGRWATTWAVGGSRVTMPVAELASVSIGAAAPMRRFSWRTGQRHRPGLEYMVSTGRHHGVESREEAMLLLALDFAGAVRTVLSQPFRLAFAARDGDGEHIPDFLVDTVDGRWLIDVRPGRLVRAEDRVRFAAAAEAALAAGWGYAVIPGWRRHVQTVLDTLSAQRRRLDDPLGLQVELLQAASGGPIRFGELVAGTRVPAVARAHALHLLWHRRLGVALDAPLGDASLIHPVPRSQRSRT